MKNGKRVNQGSTSWFKDDVLHREDGPAVEFQNGDKQWWLNGEPHREDGPALENANGARHWYIHGKLHREDGPAVEFYKQSFFEWYINGHQITEEEHNQWRMKKDLNEKLHSTLDPRPKDKKNKI